MTHSSIIVQCHSIAVNIHPINLRAHPHVVTHHGLLIDRVAVEHDITGRTQDVVPKVEAWISHIVVSIRERRSFVTALRCNVACAIPGISSSTNCHCIVVVQDVRICHGAIKEYCFNVVNFVCVSFIRTVSAIRVAVVHVIPINGFHHIRRG